MYLHVAVEIMTGFYEMHNTIWCSLITCMYSRFTACNILYQLIIFFLATQVFIILSTWLEKLNLLLL